MTRVACLRRLDEDAAQALGVVPPDVEVTGEHRPDVGFLVPASGSRVDLGRMPGLEVVQLLSAGVDWIVDRMPEGVTLCGARGTRDGAVAEWVLAALLADAKRARVLAEAQAAHRWEDIALGDLAGSHVLVLGHGSIGRVLERMLVACGCRVSGVARRARDGAHGLDELAVLLPQADAVVNLLPLTPHTRGLLGAGALRRMRDGAVLVNAGRGATVDTEALLRECREGRLRAVLDVVEPEPLPAEHPLWECPGVIVTPHHAGDTPAAARAAWALAGDQLRRWAAGEPLHNVVAADGY